MLHKLKAPIDKCPYCGCDSGFYTKDYAYGVTRCYRRFSGEEANNSELIPALIYRPGKYAYCIDCNKRLFKTSELEV